MLKDSIIQFFKQKINVDVSNYSISSKELDGTRVGTYCYESNSISIDVDKINSIYKGISDVVIDTTVVHELVHLCQLKFNKSLILPINGVFTGRLVNSRYAHLPAYKQPLEIDATIIECYYLYCNGELTNEGVVLYAELMLANVKGEDVLKYIKRLKDCGFNSVMCQISQIKNMKECC